MGLFANHSHIIDVDRACLRISSVALISIGGWYLQTEPPDVGRFQTSRRRDKFGGDLEFGQWCTTNFPNLVKHRNFSDLPSQVLTTS